MEIEFISWIFKDLGLIHFFRSFFLFIFIIRNFCLFVRIKSLSIALCDISLRTYVIIIIDVNFTSLQLFSIISTNWDIIVRVNANAKLEFSTISTITAGIFKLLIGNWSLIHYLVTISEVLQRPWLISIDARLLTKYRIAWIMKVVALIHPEVMAISSMFARTLTLIRIYFTRIWRLPGFSFLIFRSSMFFLFFIEFLRNVNLSLTRFLLLRKILSCRCIGKTVITPASSEYTTGASPRLSIGSFVYFFQAFF